MNKKTIIMSFVALFMALGMSQSVMAKEKKVKYLGHYYRGEVNDKKVPAGKGIMNVNGLMIKGDFSDHSVSNAKVWRIEYLGTANTEFSGTITYDESDNIVLKAGGVLSTKYYKLRYKGSSSLQSNHPSFIENTLKEDRVVNSGNIEPVELTFPSKFEIEDYYFKKLNPPVFKTSYTVGLTHVDWYAGQKINMDVFCEYPRDDERSYISNYKDNEGRIWNFDIDNNKKGRFSVKYPNGSYFEYESKDGFYSVFWGIRYPNGKIVKTNCKSIDWSGHSPAYDMGSHILKTNCRISVWDIIEVFAKNVNNDKFLAPCRQISITSDSLDFSKFSNSEMEKFIREEVIPYVDNGTSEYATYTTPNGKYEEGVFTSNEQAAAAQAKRDAEKSAVLNKSIASFKKKYGFDPSVNDVKYIVKVGRNLLGILDARNEWVNDYANNRNAIVTVSLAKDQGASKCYKFFWYNTAYYCGYFWVRNNVITSIHWER